jgi:hypothetical protein
MNTRKLLLTLTALFGFTAAAIAQTQVTDATVAKVTGTATVTLADGSSQPLTTGMKVPQGATVTTGADGDVFLQTHQGTIAVLKADTTVVVDELSVTTSKGKVTEEKTVINLKSGNLVSGLDPAKKKVNNYQVRTPKGVAAARGTTFVSTVTITTVNGAVTYNVSVSTSTGAVTMTPVDGGASISIAQGQASIDGADAVAVSALGAESQSLVVQAMTAAAATLAAAADQNLIPAAEVAAAVTNIINAAPAAAAAVSQAVSAVVTSGSAAAVINAAVQNAAAATVVPQITTPVTTPQQIDVSTVSRSN